MAESAILNCVICGNPASVEDAKTDANGKAVHQECFIASLRDNKFQPESEPAKAIL